MNMLKTVKTIALPLTLFSICVAPGSNSAEAANEIALISTDTAGFSFFDVAQEAAEYGAKIIVFPEWGYYPDQVDINSQTIQKWQSFAREHAVYIFLDTRYQSKNTVFSFGPEGSMKTGIRRDGNNSPLPQNSQEASPLIVETEFGNIAVLICDEVRSKVFVDEIKNSIPPANFIVSPNLSGDFSNIDTVKSRAVSMDYEMDVFIADTIGKFSFNGGNHTHAYRFKTNEIELNRFGTPSEFASWENFSKLNPEGNYFISYHDLPQR